MLNLILLISVIIFLVPLTKWFREEYDDRIYMLRAGEEYNHNVEYYLNGLFLLCTIVVLGIVLSIVAVSNDVWVSKYLMVFLVGPWVAISLSLFVAVIPDFVPMATKKKHIIALACSIVNYISICLIVIFSHLDFVQV